MVDNRVIAYHIIIPLTLLTITITIIITIILTIIATTIIIHHHLQYDYHIIVALCYF